MEIAIDFDGTCVTHEYPSVGNDIGAVPVLKELIQNGHSLILWTMRSGKELEDAVEWFKKNEIPLYGIQKNPSQDSWTNSPKCYAHLYIDDAALGAPLILAEGRAHIDWVKTKELLKKEGLIQGFNEDWLRGEGYTHIREVPGRGICALYRFIYTTGLVFGIDAYGYVGRYCYEHLSDAIEDLETWDGKDDPPGEWIKYKGRGGERSKNQHSSF